MEVQKEAAPILGFEELCFSLSGFKLRGKSVEKTGLTKDDIIRIIVSSGASVSMGGMIEGTTTHLLCISPAGPKYDVAMRWGPTKIKVVDLKWLQKCLEYGHRIEEPPQDQLIGHHPNSPSVHKNYLDLYSPHRLRASGVGKQRRSSYLVDDSVKLRLFLFGGGSFEDFGWAKLIVESLGGEVIGSWPPDNQFVYGCTHLILWELRRTEKFLCACASGTWVLTDEYLRKSASAGKFLDETDFEWGSSSTRRQSDQTKTLAEASRQRRVESHMLFKDTKFIIFGDTSPPPLTLHRIVSCGGGVATLVPDCDEFNANELIAYSGATSLILIASDSIGYEAEIKVKSLLPSAHLVTPLYLLDLVCSCRPGSVNLEDVKYRVSYQH
jgi:twin BRCT domain/BRCA1 C Terminus (BRCT) domain